MKAAVEARGLLRILAVTVLTSYDDADLAAAGYDFTVSELGRSAPRRPATSAFTAWFAPALRRRRCGRSGSPHDAGQSRDSTGRHRRGRSVAHHDPARAIAAGADHLVVGRPILAAPDPKAAAAAIVAEIAAATRDEAG